MASQQVAKYHIAPNFTIPPIEAGGVLTLGSIIAGIGSADEPLNDNCRLRIPQEQLFCSHQSGFTATRSRMTSGEYGVWAKIAGVDGVGGELSWAPERTAEDVYRFRSIDTIYFNPSQKYLEESMKQDDVHDYIVGSGFDPVYVVTGLKTARGPAVRMFRSKSRNAKVEMGVQGPTGLPIELGPRFNISREARQEMGFEDSTDFIVGIRVRKVMYKKHWLTRAPGTFAAAEYNKGATMVDEDFVEDEGEIVDLGDTSDGETEVEECVNEGSVPETIWLVRQS